MEIQITEQLRSFLLAILLGMAVGVVYDLMRAVRLRHPRLTAVPVSYTHLTLPTNSIV